MRSASRSRPRSAGDKLEVRVRGPNVTPGYWKRPDLTAAAFDEDGFYKPGDAVRFAEPAEIGGRQARSARARAERDPGLLETARSHCRRLRRGRLLQAGRCGPLRGAGRDRRATSSKCACAGRT